MAELVPPPRFGAMRFETFRPDPDQPTQAAALARLREFARMTGERRRLRAAQRWRRRTDPGASAEYPTGLYLDGGFGVGKTHLLASLWHAVPGPKAFGTFVELTNLAGALGFQQTVDALSAYRLVCVDEFELDEPDDTALVADLLGRLASAGVCLAATPSTLPERLGEGRFAPSDFLREIRSVAARFEVVRVDGPDYRHRGLPIAPVPRTAAELTEYAHADADRPPRPGRPRPVTTLDDFDALTEHLAALDPSRYGALLDGVGAVCLRDVSTLTDQDVALRVVVLADRLYDREIPVLSSGVPLDQLFGAELLAGGYRKKYLRAVSRLVALGRTAPPAR